jgi:protein-tyrosine phosphatase
LNERFELVERYPDYVEWLCGNHPQRAIWYPVADLGAPEFEGAVSLLGELRTRIKHGEGLLLHCGAGIGRTGTIAAGLLVTMGFPLTEAIRTVKAQRAPAGPQATPQQDLLMALARAGARGRIG